MIITLKSTLWTVFAKYRTSIEETMKKHKVDPKKAVKVMQDLPTSYAYAGSYSVQLYTSVKKMVDKEIREANKKK